jgi:hypothetical protein
MTRLPSDIAACYEAMREQATRNAKFDMLGFIMKRFQNVSTQK